MAVGPPSGSASDRTHGIDADHPVVEEMRQALSGLTALAAGPD